jgi:hypothetical protein
MAIKEDMIDRAKSEYTKWREESVDYQYRFCYELVELKDRIERLKILINNKAENLHIEAVNIERLKVQLKIMEAYLEIMRIRYNSDHL